MKTNNAVCDAYFAHICTQRHDRCSPNTVRCISFNKHLQSDAVILHITFFRIQQLLFTSICIGITSLHRISYVLLHNSLTLLLHELHINYRLRHIFAMITCDNTITNVTLDILSTLHVQITYNKQYKRTTMTLQLYQHACFNIWAHSRSLAATHLFTETTHNNGNNTTTSTTATTF